MALPVIIAQQPYGISYQDWTANLAGQLAQYGVPAGDLESDWQNWACSLFYIPDLAARNIPEPTGDWRTWASRFIECIER